MVASTDPELVDRIESVTDVKDAIDTEMVHRDHQPRPRQDLHRMDDK